MFKVIVIGNSSVGKTSIVNRFVGDRFDSNYKATVTADFQTKILDIRGNEIRLQMWDLVGMDTNFAGINKAFCRSASGAVFVGDLTDTDTIEMCSQWKENVEALVDGQPIPMILCGNKCDIIQEMEENGEQLQELQTQEGLDNFAQTHGFIGAIRASAKEDINITPMMATLTRQMLIKELTQNQKTSTDDLNASRKESFHLNRSRDKIVKNEQGCKC